MDVNVKANVEQELREVNAKLSEVEATRAEAQATIERLKPKQDLLMRLLGDALPVQVDPRSLVAQAKLGTPPGVPAGLPATGEKGKVVEYNFKDQKLEDCVAKVLHDQKKATTYELAEALLLGGYSNRWMSKKPTLAGLQNNLVNMLSTNINGSKPRFKRVARGVYALS